MFTSRDKDEWEAKDDKNGSQFANPSADSQYIEDEINRWDPIPLSWQQSGVWISEQESKNWDLYGEYKGFTRLASVLEKGLKKLNNSIDMLISAQSVHFKIADGSRC